MYSVVSTNGQKKIRFSSCQKINVNVLLHQSDFKLFCLLNLYNIDQKVINKKPILANSIESRKTKVSICIALIYAKLNNAHHYP